MPAGADRSAATTGTAPADLDAHLTAPHLAAFAGRLGDLLDGSGLIIERVRRIA
jgi:hypothetical protein